MNPSEKNEKWLDDVLTNALGSDGAHPNFEQWRKGHPEAIETLKSRAETESSVSQRPQNVWRTIMKNRMTRFAATAVIIIGVLFGLYFIGGPDMAGVAWAEVVENVEQIQTYMFSGRGTTTGGPLGDDVQEMEMTGYWSLVHGMRMQSYMDGKIAMDMYMLPAEKMMIQLMPEQKKYMRILLTEELLKKMEEEQNNPRYMVKQFMAVEYSELGRDVIDGIEVEGIEVTDPKVWGGMVEKAVGRLWVDVATNLPVRMEMEMVMEDIETKMVMDQFQWGIELDPSLFEPVIPADYELMGEVEMPDAGGEKAVEGLRLFAEMTGGSYPSDMGMMTAIQEIMEAMREELVPEPNAMPSRETTEKMMKVQMICVFYALLVQEDKDPAYYGDKITTEFGHAVLMRWKTADGQYRVIFGDLTIEDVSADELAELESLPLNMNPYAIKPTPADGAVGSSIVGLKLSWMPGAYVTQHQVYFGTESDDLSLLGEVAEPVYDELGALEEDTTYYWRVDEVQPDGSVAIGDEWSFNTGAFVGWWKLDDDAGDASGNGYNGSLNNMGNGNWVDGALEFDGEDDYVSIPALNLNSNNVTISAWIKRNGQQVMDYTGIVFSRNSNTIAGINIVHRPDSTANYHLGYHWNNDPKTWGWNSKLLVADNKWIFVALVVEPEKATVYMNDGSGMKSSINKVHHDIEEFNGITNIGQDPEGQQKRFFKGLIDDVRIYSYALTVDEVGAIYDSAMATSAE